MEHFRETWNDFQLFFLLFLKKNSIFRIFCRSYGGGTNCGPLAKLKKGHVQSSRLFNRAQGGLGAGLPNGATETFEETFLGYLTENVALTIFLLFRAVQFRAGNMTRRPKKAFFWGWDALGSLGLRGISSTLNITTPNPEA